MNWYPKKQNETNKRNKDKYRTILFRVRRDSELDKLLLEYAINGETSINFLLTKAICKVFNCKLPHRQYTKTKRTRII